MRLLALSRTLPFHSIGGMQAVAWDVLREIAGMGHDVTVITTRIPGRDGPFRASNVDVVPLPETNPERADRRWWRASRRFVAENLIGRVDAVLSVSSGALGLLPLRSQGLDVPFIFQAHGTAWGEAVSKWRHPSVRNALASVRNLAWLARDVRVYPEFACIVPIGRAVERAFCEWPLAPFVRGLRIELIPNGVDTRQFRPAPDDRDSVRQEFGWPATSRILLFCSRLHPQKGADAALRAFDLIAEDQPDVRMLVIGGGQEEGRLRERCRHAVAAGVVRFTGALPREVLPRYYAASDVMLFPSTMVEGLPMTVLEAVAAGLPVVCFQSMRETIAPSLPVSYAANGSIPGIAREASAWMNRLRGGDAIAALPKEFTLAHSAARYVELIDSL